MRFSRSTRSVTLALSSACRSAPIYGNHIIIVIIILIIISIIIIITIIMAAADVETLSDGFLEKCSGI